MQKMLHQAGIRRLAGAHQRGDVLEEVVDALELVIVHRVILGKLKLLQPQVLLRDEAGDIQRAEQPAAAGMVLMGDSAVVNDRGEAPLQAAGTVIVACDILDAGDSNRIHGEVIMLARVEFLTQIVQCFSAQRRDLVHSYPLSVQIDDFCLYSSIPDFRYSCVSPVRMASVVHTAGGAPESGRSSMCQCLERHGLTDAVMTASAGFSKAHHIRFSNQLFALPSSFAEDAGS